ncbi:MAG: hypothetical protein LIO77_08840 [Rikenellaceae bacterium]|nr:hypothetical protein [Rikenellaceae bacterium]
MSKIEKTKEYSGTDLETIFFRPMFTGPDATSLGIKVMYNMPVPTTLHFWKRGGDILQKYTAAGWNGGISADKYQKTIDMHRIKAEVGYSADEYFDLVYEKVVNQAGGTMDDLSGTVLEQAETALFREAIAESIRVTMWLGDASTSGEYSTFDGLLKRIFADRNAGETGITNFTYDKLSDPDDPEELFKTLWEKSSDLLRAFKSQGELVYLVTSDVYAKYEDVLDNILLDSAYIAKQNGRERLSYRGIPVVDVQLTPYLPSMAAMPQSFAILTDRRNLALAVNTSHFPGTEVKMWYNPDLMENRQRAVFMAGCDYLLPELLSIAILDA